MRTERIIIESLRDAVRLMHERYVAGESLSAADLAYIYAADGCVDALPDAVERPPIERLEG